MPSPIVIRDTNIIRAVEGAGEGVASFRVRISSPTLDSHYTRMDTETTLNNFVRDINEGNIPVCHHHNKAVIYGGCRDAKIDDEGNVECTIEIDKGLELVHSQAPYRTSDQLIAQIQKKRITKNSVGASGGWWKCNIDGADMFNSRDCYHWPGIYYEVGKQNKERIRCEPTLMDFHLSEVSTVYAGSNPDAIFKERVEQHLEEGRLSRKQLFFINRSFGLTLDLDRAKPDDPEFKGDEMSLTKEEMQEIMKEATSSIVKGVADLVSGESSDEGEVPKAILDRLDKLEADKAELEEQLSQVAKVSVDSEKQDLINSCRAVYLDLRKDKVTSESLKAYEDKLGKLTNAELKDELDTNQAYLTKLKESEEKSGEEDETTRKTTDETRKNFDDLGFPGNPDWINGPDPENSGDDLV